MTTQGQLKGAAEWKCVGCGKPHPDRVRACECPTNVLYIWDGKKITHEIKMKSAQDQRDEAFAELEAMARKINPRLPADLSGHIITISLSKDHQTATATKAPRP